MAKVARKLLQIAKVAKKFSSNLWLRLIGTLIGIKALSALGTNTGSCISLEQSRTFVDILARDTGCDSPAELLSVISSSGAWNFTAVSK